MNRQTAHHRTRRVRPLLTVLGTGIVATVLAGCAANPPPTSTPPPPPPVARVKVVDGNGADFAPSVSDDGTVVSFISTSGDIVADPAIDPPEVYVLDRTTGVTTPLGRAPVWGNQGPSTQVSGNGRYVVFSTTDGLSPADTDGFLADIYRYDRTTGTSTLISTLPDYGEIQFNVAWAGPDTSTIAFVQDSTCATGCGGGWYGVWHEGIGISPAWNQASVLPVSFSPNGRYAVTRTINALDPADLDSTSDWYVFDFDLSTWTFFPGVGALSYAATVADDGDLLSPGFGVIDRFDRVNPSAPPTTTPTSLNMYAFGVFSGLSDTAGVTGLTVESLTPADPSTAASPSTCTWRILALTAGSVDLVQTVTASTGSSAFAATAACYHWYRPGASADWSHVAYASPFDLAAFSGPQDGIWVLDRSA